MATVLRKQLLHQVLFIACVAIPYFNIYEATFGIWSITVMLTFKNRYSYTILNVIACFASIFAIAFVAVLLSDEDVKLYNFIRDITYLLKPIMGLLIGYQLCKDYTVKPLEIIINTGIVLALVHLGLVGYGIGIKHMVRMDNLREFAGYFSDFEVYSIIVLLFHKKFDIPVSRNKMIFAVTVLAISTFFYLSRTNFIQFGILFLAMKGYLVLNRRSFTIIGATVLVLGIGYSAIYIYNPKRNQKGVDALLYKIKNAPIEPFKTKVNRDNWKDFHDNYRSYENIYTVRQVTDGGAKTIAVGKGMGSTVDLKQKVWLQTSYMRYIPFLHNGFMTVFLKSGLLGVLILIVSISLMFRYQPSADPQIQNINYLLLGTGMFLIISYWVFMGLYFVADTKSIVIGYLIAAREVLLRKQRFTERLQE